MLKKIVLIIIYLFTFVTYLFSQILPQKKDVDIIKGKVKRIETFYYYPKKTKSTKVVFEYDSTGRI